MNREIKFRGKRVDNDEWVYGNLQQQAVKNEEWYITSITAPVNEFLNESHIIDSKTVGQYTGLKDKNGKEIYENMEIDNKYIVFYKECKYILKDISKGDIIDLWRYINENGGKITKEYTKI